MNDALKQTVEEYLGEQGLSSPISNFMIDKLRIPHGLTDRKAKGFEKHAKKEADDYQERRAGAIKEYREKIESGVIIPKTKEEIRIETANGNPDNPSVTAARRRCEKLGIDWRKING